MSPKIKYHKKNSILSLRFSSNKSVDSDIQGNVVLDYDKNGKVVNIEVMDVNIENFMPVRQMHKFAIERV